MFDQSVNRMQAPGAMMHRVGDDTAIERGQLATVCNCKREKIAVRDLTAGEQARRVELSRIQQADVARPEDVAGQRNQSCE